MGNMGCWLEKNARIVRFADGCPLLRGWISMVYCLQLGQWAGIQTEHCPIRLITWYTVYTPLNQGRTPKFPQVSQKWTWSFWLSMLELWARRTWSVQAEPWGPGCSDLWFFPQFPTFPNLKPRSCRVSSPDRWTDEHIWFPISISYISFHFCPISNVFESPLIAPRVALWSVTQGCQMIPFDILSTP